MQALAEYISEQAVKKAFFAKSARRRAVITHEAEQVLLCEPEVVPRYIRPLMSISLSEDFLFDNVQKQGVRDLHFGFSYVGLIYLVMLMTPNIIWSRNLPKDYEKYAANENNVLLAFERIGEVFVSTLCLIFSDFNIGSIRLWSIVLLVSFLLMILYEVYWIRYFLSEKTMGDMYSSILGIPVAGATLPVLAFFLLGLYGTNIPMMIATVILGIGHIGIHLNHKKEAEADDRDE